MTVSNRAPGGSADPMARGSERVLSRTSVPKIPDNGEYLPGAADAEAAGKFIESVQKHNANMDVNELGRLAKWASGEVVAWQDHVKAASLSMPIPLSEWLSTRYASDYLTQMDDNRAASTKQNIDDAYDRRQQAIEGGYREPDVPRRGMEDVDLVTDGGSSLPRKELDVTERVIQSFRRDRDPGIRGFDDAWCRKTLREYREYLRLVGRKNTPMTARQYLETSFLYERGMTR